MVAGTVMLVLTDFAQLASPALVAAAREAVVSVILALALAARVVVTRIDCV